MASLQGAYLGARPDLWQAYSDAREQVLEAAKPARELVQRFPGDAAQINQAIAATGHSPDSLMYLPLLGRKSAWTVLLDATTAEVVGFMPLDSF